MTSEATAKILVVQNGVVKTLTGVAQNSKRSQTIRFAFRGLLYWWNIIFCVGLVFFLLNGVVLMVLTGVTDQKLIKSNLLKT
jgi:hypothetical protein